MANVAKACIFVLLVGRTGLHVDGNALLAGTSAGSFAIGSHGYGGWSWKLRLWLWWAEMDLWFLKLCCVSRQQSVMLAKPIGPSFNLAGHRPQHET